MTSPHQRSPFFTDLPLSKRRKTKPGVNHFLDLPKDTQDTKSSKKRITASSNDRTALNRKKAHGKKSKKSPRNGLSQKIAKPEPASEEDSESHQEYIICEICTIGNEEDKLLLCDKCDQGFHTFCLEPPLREVPKNEWFCYDCVKKKQSKKKKQKPSIKETLPHKCVAETVPAQLYDEIFEPIIDDSSDSDSADPDHEQKDEEEENFPEKSDASSEETDGEEAEYAHHRRQSLRNEFSSQKTLREKGVSSPTSRRISTKHVSPGIARIRKEVSIQRKFKGINTKFKQKSDSNSEEDEDDPNGIDDKQKSHKNRSKTEEIYFSKKPTPKKKKDKISVNEEQKPKDLVHSSIASELDDLDGDYGLLDTEEQESKCEVCGSFEDDDKMLLCDKCDSGYHIFCLFPALERIPTEDWYCPICVGSSPDTMFAAKAKTYSKPKLKSKQKDKPEMKSPIKLNSKPNPKILETPSSPSKLPIVSPIASSKHKLPSQHPSNHRPQKMSQQLLNNRQSSSDDNSQDSPNQEITSANDLLGEIKFDTTSSEKASLLISEYNKISEEPKLQKKASESSLQTNPSATFSATISSTSTTAPTTTTPNSVIPSSSVVVPTYGGSTVARTFWSGSLSFEKKFICNVDAYCKAEQKNQVYSKEWPSVLQGTKKPIFLTINTTFPVVDFLPQKDDPHYEYFIWELENEKMVCSVMLGFCELLVVASSFLPLHTPVTSRKKSSLLGIVLPIVLPHTNKGLVAKPSGFMKGKVYALLGYEIKGGDARVTATVQQLGSQGAQLREHLHPSELNLVVINTNFMSKVVDSPNFLECRLNPKIQFIRGIEYLENCFKHKQILDPISHHALLFPNGGIILPLADILLQQEGLLDNLFCLFNMEKRLGNEWILKIHKLSTKDLKKETNNQNATKVLEMIDRYEGATIHMVTEEEESKSKNNIPFSIRLGLKLSFLNANKYRHVILLTNDKELQEAAKNHKLLCMDYNGLLKFLEDQKKRAQISQIAVTSANENAH
eukprot:TRINITY_DN9873_c0_g1_i1.p1 TRINITY_DN9873_c0_g1~~TRINITY_DN9873_c0_g1_i1.p1  ORF type:complete len:1009 (-),score=185.30 TRINITY_DN9873_c0_g1_i1:109-3135(-)